MYHLEFSDRRMKMTIFNFLETAQLEGNEMGKYIIITLLIFLSGSLYASERGFILHCPSRKQIKISVFNNRLTTAMWPKNFFVSSGPRKTQTRSGRTVMVTFFQNGDGMLFYPSSKSYFFYFSKAEKTEKCRLMSTFTYKLTPLRKVNGR